MVKPAKAQSQGMGKGRNNAVSAGIDIPIGNFTTTHSGGIGIDYSLGRHSYGYMDILAKKPFAFTVNAGGDYYFGKKEMIGIYHYEYPAYTYLHVYGGAIYHTGSKTNIFLIAGAALGIYSGNAEIGFGINLGGNYYLRKNIAITPGIILMKISRADPLWVGSLRASYCF